jgi:hypothetical protein
MRVVNFRLDNANFDRLVFSEPDHMNEEAQETTLGSSILEGEHKPRRQRKSDSSAP